LDIKETYETANNFFALCGGDFFHDVLLCPEVECDESRLEAEVYRVVVVFFRACVPTDSSVEFLESLRTLPLALTE
jgi:hypothetical protein